MYKKEKYIFDSSGWQINAGLLDKTKNTVLSFREKRENNQVPIFSIIDSDGDIEEIINNSKFFTKNELKDFILIGTGGSSLGADALIQSYKYKNLNSGINFHILDNLDPNSVSKIFNLINPKTSKFLAISKSGKTTETIVLLLIVIDWLQKNDIKLDKSIMVMCQVHDNQDQEIIEIAKTYNLKIIQHENVGGRFAALTSTGLLPATIMGLDPYSIRSAARNTLNDVFNDNLFILASSVFSNIGIKEKKLNCVIHYGDALGSFVGWYRQLWNESLGKDSKGTFLITGKGSVDQHSQLQMWLDGPNIANYTFLKINNKEGYKIPKSEITPWLSNFSAGEILNIMADSTYDALKESGRAVRNISIQNASPESIASLMVTFILEVLVVSELLGVDPYSQNAVEAIKKNSAKRFKKYELN